MTVITTFSTSLDGFIADPDDDVGPLFDRHTAGDVEVRLDLVPVLLGKGIRYFDDAGQVMLEDPQVIEGVRATHLRYRVRRG
jgi:hypothetical protein